MSVVMQHQSLTCDIVLSDVALQRVVSFLQKEEQSIGLRLSVKKTGCSGLSYVMDYVEKQEVGDIVFPLFGDYLLCIDKKSYPYLKGMSIDYVKQGLNHKFVFENPNQTGQCGCGESFTVD